MSRFSSNATAVRKRRWSAAFRRWAIRFAMRDDRARRATLNHLFKDHLAPNTLCLVPFSDHNLYVDPRDDKIAYTVLRGRAWQRRQLDAAVEFANSVGRLTPYGVFVDVGANIGTMTIYALLSKLFSRAVAIEPDQHNRSILHRNLAINNYVDLVATVSAAASNSAGDLPFYRDAKNLGAHSLVPGFARSQLPATTVRAERLDDLIASVGVPAQNIGMVKIDVEGHEASVLEGMPQILANAPPLLIEATFPTLDPVDRPDALADLLRHIPPAYTHCALADPEDAKLGLTRTKALRKFRPSQLQHDLLIY